MSLRHLRTGEVKRDKRIYRTITNVMRAGSKRLPTYCGAEGTHQDTDRRSIEVAMIIARHHPGGSMAAQDLAETCPVCLRLAGLSVEVTS